MNGQSIARWTLSAGLAAGSLFFWFSGFVTGLLGTGKQSKDVAMWQSQARFRVAVAATFWLLAVLVFLSLRRGGASGIWKGESIGGLKKWFYLILFLCSFLVGIYLWGVWLWWTS